MELISTAPDEKRPLHAARTGIGLSSPKTLSQNDQRCLNNDEAMMRPIEGLTQVF
jgi:hypothetical protein